MNAKIDDLDLVLLKHEDDEPSNPVQDLRTIASVWTTNRRAIIEHKVPGREASVLHDLGRGSLRFALSGDFMGPDAKTTSENLWGKFTHGQILPFSSDMVALADVTKVVIEQLEFTGQAGDNNRYRYYIVLREHKDPPPKEADAPDQSDDASDNVDDETDDAAASVNYVTGKVLDSDKEPVKDAKVVIKGDQGEFETKTDESGVFRKDDLEPGKYEVTIDAPGYEDQKKNVEIKGGEGETGGETEGSGASEEQESKPAEGETE